MNTPPASHNATPLSVITGTTGTNDTLKLSRLIRASIADTQFEVQRAQSRIGRWKALARGYAAVARIVVVSPFVPRQSLGRLLVTLLLGTAGSSLVVVVFSQWGGPIEFAPFFLFAVVTAVVLRTFRLGSSYRQMFAACAIVLLMMGTTSFLSVIWDRHWNLPDVSQLDLVFGLLWRVGAMVGCMLFGSALAATIAWPAIDRGSGFGQITSALLIGSYVFAFVWFAIGLLYRYGDGLGFLLGYAASTLLQAFFFAVLSAFIVIPLLSLLRRLIRGRIPLMFAAALLFPLPFFAQAFIGWGSSGIARAWTSFTSFPSVLGLLPWAIAAGAVGWCLATPCLTDPRRETRVE